MLMWSPHAHIIKIWFSPVNLLYVIWIIQPTRTKGVRGKFNFLPWKLDLTVLLRFKDNIYKCFTLKHYTNGRNFRKYSLRVNSSDIQHCSSHGTRKLITEILWHTRKCSFCRSAKKKIGIILTHSHQMPSMLVVVIFLFDNKGREVSAPE